MLRYNSTRFKVLEQSNDVLMCKFVTKDNEVLRPYQKITVIDNNVERKMQIMSLVFDFSIANTRGSCVLRLIE